MSAGLYENDWMVSTKERPWHGIGTVVEDAPTSDEALRLAKLDWTVNQFPVFANNKEVEGFFANVRSDTNETLGIVKNRYTIQQNTESFAFVDNIIQNNNLECRYETAGSLYNGRKVFLLVRLPEQTLVGDKVENFLFFTNSHDGSSQLMAGITNVRVVCNNTLQLALKEAPRIWKCKHTANINDRVEEAKQTLGLAVQYIENLQETADSLASKKFREELFFRELYEKNPMKLSEKNLQTTIERIHTIYEEKEDLRNIRGTAWGIYNAVADFCSNTTPFKTPTYRTKEYKLDGFFSGDKFLAVTQDILMAA